jgi:modification methylase
VKDSAGSARPVRKATATSAFGVGKRESHDASAFYRRFAAPAISADDSVCHPDDRPMVDRILLGDIRGRSDTVAPNSVALVVTSPPYFSGKEYETAVGEGHVPGTYREYLAMLAGVFEACGRALEPGGRMAINVANLGRKPYRSLSADVIGILENDLGLLLRGEVVWQKARGAAGNCAWGTFQHPRDPVLRDLTERVVIASKGRFDRAIPPRDRAALGYPSEATVCRDEFLEATLDLWEIPPESATRTGHPAPFPVELPERLIELYTYRGDLVVDPFVGSGTTAVAALRTGRHFLGYDTEPGYVEAALTRVEAARRPDALLPADPDPGISGGHRLKERAGWALEAAGFTVTATAKRLGAGVTVDFVAADARGHDWYFDVYGSLSITGRRVGGLRRAEDLWRAAGKGTVLQHIRPGGRYVALTAAAPPARRLALAAVTGPDKPLHAVIDVVDGDGDGGEALRRLASGA